MCLGRRGGGAGDRSPVPSALAAVCAGGRCAEVRHRCPRTGPSGPVPARGARAGCAASWCRADGTAEHGAEWSDGHSP
ncbi:hypothetical protein E4U91_30775 [Streptomyces lasalocidi]|uniref:Uncharacterized protein n=1 Tax=Streptomyces lasalocidi TaxID=324833 RepID=A0A4U5WRJ0_STRLS|nr:hypothetical protein E4U91_30775 [Streptomyces lasalocidi]